MTRFTAMLGWIGMITSVVAGIGGLSQLTMLCYHSSFPVEDTTSGILLVLVTPVWFYLSFQLRKKVQENDLVDRILFGIQQINVEDLGDERYHCPYIIP